jgi:exopolysaccharide biosynthesis polyprenyl glycosylphosphotransferase
VTRDRWLEQMVLLQDLLLVLAAMVLTKLLHGQLAPLVPGLKPPVAASEYAHLVLVFVPTWLFAAERLGVHRTATLGGPALEMVRRVVMIQGWGLAAIALILTAAQVSVNRSLIAIYMLVSTALLLGAQVLQRRWLRRRRGMFSALVVGGDAAADGDEATVADMQRLRGRRVERLPSADPGALRGRFRAGPVDEVVLVPSLPRDQVWALVEVCVEAGVPALVPVDGGAPGAAALPPPGVEPVGSAHYLVYERHRPDGPSHVVKAIADRVLAAVLVVALLPLMLVLAALVALFVGRPALYVQRRAGLHGRSFSMLKLRTMRLDADDQRAALLPHNEMDGPAFKMTRDPRITPFGRVLRRWSLDELPQLFNVLAGQMSLVGPRPLLPDETEALRGGHRRRLAMRPGLTCLWQVSGRSDLTFPEWMALDLEYVDRWSLGLDLAILIRTLPAILSGRGAR